MPEILIVEDESIVGLDIQKRLRRMGYQALEVVSTGKEAIEYVERKLPDLILMDIEIHGDIDGVETANRIREHFGVPIVYLTAFSDDSTLQRAKVTEAFGYQALKGPRALQLDRIRPLQALGRPAVAASPRRVGNPR